MKNKKSVLLIGISLIAIGFGSVMFKSEAPAVVPSAPISTSEKDNSTILAAFKFLAPRSAADRADWFDDRDDATPVLYADGGFLSGPGDFEISAGGEKQFLTPATDPNGTTLGEIKARLAEFDALSADSESGE